MAGIISGAPPPVNNYFNNFYIALQTNKKGTMLDLCPESTGHPEDTMNRNMIAIAAAAMAVHAGAQTLRLPCRMVRTTTTYSRLTGIEIDSESKSKLTPVAVTVRRITDDDEALIEMQTRPAKLEDEDGASTVRIPAEDRDAIIEALVKARQALARPRGSEAVSDTLHNDNGLTLTLTLGRRRYLLMEWEDGRQFELASSHIQQLTSAMKRL